MVVVLEVRSEEEEASSSWRALVRQYQRSTP